VDLSFNINALAGGQLLGGVSFKGGFGIGDHVGCVGLKFGSGPWPETEINLRANSLRRHDPHQVRRVRIWWSVSVPYVGRPCRDVRSLGAGGVPVNPPFADLLK
jgi:hypothetical protein